MPAIRLKGEGGKGALDRRYVSDVSERIGGWGGGKMGNETTQVVVLDEEESQCKPVPKR